MALAVLGFNYGQHGIALLGTDFARSTRVDQFVEWKIRIKLFITGTNASA